MTKSVEIFNKALSSTYEVEHRVKEAKVACTSQCVMQCIEHAEYHLKALKRQLNMAAKFEEEEKEGKA